MLEPRQRTAIDGKVWWCVYDTSTNKFAKGFWKYKTKRECQGAILCSQIKTVPSKIQFAIH